MSAGDDRDPPSPDPTVAAPSRGGRPRRSPLGELLPRRRPRQWTVEERREVMDELFFEGPRRWPYLKRFTVLIVLSSAIASFGLLSNSAAVVIGAMLVAPLMTPILALAGALVSGQLLRAAQSVAILLYGTAAAIGVGWLASKLLAGPVTADALTSELLARTAPGILDLGIAIAAGAAAAYILTDRGATSALPGVAIAVALVPPLATVGITLGLGAHDEAGGALLLFSTNLVAIVLSAAVVFVLTGFVDRDVVGFDVRRVRIGFTITVLATIAVAVPLGIHTREVVVDEQFERSVVKAVAAWDPQAEIIDVKTDRRGDTATVDLVLASPVDPVPAWQLAELVSDRDELERVEVTLRYRPEIEDEAETKR